jgi:hypothetical protein
MGRDVEFTGREALGRGSSSTEDLRRSAPLVARRAPQRAVLLGVLFHRSWVRLSDDLR